jgi:hypothetical protein
VEVQEEERALIRVVVSEMNLSTFLLGSGSLMLVPGVVLVGLSGLPWAALVFGGLVDVDGFAGASPDSVGSLDCVESAALGGLAERGVAEVFGCQGG